MAVDAVCQLPHCVSGKSFLFVIFSSLDLTISAYCNERYNNVYHLWASAQHYGPQTMPFGVY